MTDLELKQRRAEGILRKAYKPGEIIVVQTKSGNLLAQRWAMAYHLTALNPRGLVKAGRRGMMKDFLVHERLVVE